MEQGINPTRHRVMQLQASMAENAITFKSVAQEWIEKKRGKWTSYYTRK